MIGIPPANIPICDNRGMLNPAWYRYLVGARAEVDEAAAGEVGTAAGSGLSGGGVVADGVNLSIADDGVTDAMLRDSMATSVIGRFEATDGSPADIQAVDNNRVLSREDDFLAFRNFINGITIGPNIASPLVRFDLLESTDTPAASTAVVTHSLAIETAGGTYYLLLSATP